MMKDLESV